MENGYDKWKMNPNRKFHEFQYYKHIDIWLPLNKLIINFSITNYLIFNNNKAKLLFILNNTVIIKKNSIKLLGVIIETNLK